MPENPYERAKQTILIEAAAVSQQVSHLDGGFMKAIDAIAACPGRVIVMGIGKSGIVGRKIASTMSSVGIPAAFSHPAECMHGDLGMFMAGDIVLVLSYSGETEEIKKVIPSIKSLCVKIIVMTGRPQASVWKSADITINSKIEREACPYNLAPTASTTAMLALGDALSLAASLKKGFKKETLAKFHPGGSIGKILTVKVMDIMRSGKNNPVIGENMSVNDALLIMTKTRLGATNVVNKNGKLTGFFTDGDLRRKLQKDRLLLKKPLREVMTVNPVTISPESLAIDATRLLRKYNIDNMPVVDSKNMPIGVIDERDLLSEGITE